MVLAEQRRLTLRWSRLAPAWHLARLLEWYIIHPAGQVPYRRSRLSSNVRRHQEPTMVDPSAQVPWWASLLTASGAMALLSFVGERLDWSMYVSVLLLLVAVATGALAAQTHRISRASFVALVLGAVLGSYRLHEPSFVFALWSVGGFAP